MKWFRQRRSALLITPKILLFKNRNTVIALNSLKELLAYNLEGLDVFIDGFSQTFVTGSLPLVGLLDRRSAVDHKLARECKESNFFGGSFAAKDQSISYQGFGFDQQQSLSEYLKELYELQLPIVSVQSLIFSCATSLLPTCVSQMDTRSLLWVSPYLNSGYRIVFFQDNEIKFTRIISGESQDQDVSHKDLLQTLSYVQNEYHLGNDDIKIFMTFFDIDEFNALKQLFQASKVYKWDLSVSREQETDSNPFAFEDWLISYIQGSKKVANCLSSNSVLKPLIHKTNLINKGNAALQVVCVVLGLLIAHSAFNLWRYKSQLYVAQRGLETQEIEILKRKKHLKMPTQVEVLKFYAYLTSERDLSFVQDPFLLIAAVAEQLTPEILIREILWQREPKTTLKLSLNCVNMAEEDKKELINSFKDNLLESLKRKSKVDVSVNQPSTETLEIKLS